MAFAKVETTILNHPKFLPLCSSEQGLAALGLWTLGLAYAMDQLSDGRIEKAWLLGRVRGNTLRRSAELLVQQGLWHDKGDHYLIHDYDHWNLTSLQIKAEREAARERMRIKRGSRPRSPEQPSSFGRTTSAVRQQEVEVEENTTGSASPVRPNKAGTSTEAVAIERYSVDAHGNRYLTAWLHPDGCPKTEYLERFPVEQRRQCRAHRAVQTSAPEAP